MSELKFKKNDKVKINKEKFLRYREKEGWIWEWDISLIPNVATIECLEVHHTKHTKIESIENNGFIRCWKMQEKVPFIYIPEDCLELIIEGNFYRGLIKRFMYEKHQAIWFDTYMNIYYKTEDAMAIDSWEEVKAKEIINQILENIKKWENNMLGLTSTHNYILSSLFCPFCLRHSANFGNFNCHVCEYAKNHTRCNARDSDYVKIQQSYYNIFTGSPMPQNIKLTEDLYKTIAKEFKKLIKEHEESKTETPIEITHNNELDNNTGPYLEIKKYNELLSKEKRKYTHLEIMNGWFRVPTKENVGSWFRVWVYNPYEKKYGVSNGGPGRYSKEDFSDWEYSALPPE